VTAGLTERVHWRTDPVVLLDEVVAGMGGERRDGQHQLTSAVADAIAAGQHLVAEAPTGSGKSLAYLAPAIASGLKVVVATSTIALQAQLAMKDLPSLQEHGSLNFSYAVLKGRSNYLCRAKLRTAGAPDALFEQPVGREFPRQLERLRSFAEHSESGDRSELSDDINNAGWAAVSCSGAECPGKKDCADGAQCFAELARERARDASILVVNHALYCAHLASDGQVLPEHDLVILDEAHSFPDNATNAFAAEISPDALTRLAPMLAKSGVNAELASAVGEAGRTLDKALEKREGTVDIGHDAQLDSALLSAAERLAKANAALKTGGDEYAKRTARLAVGRLDVLRRLAAPGPDDVVWIEAVRSNRRLHLAPVEAGNTIGHALLMHKPVIAVSATLGGKPPFAPIAISMGFQTNTSPGSWGEPDEDGNWTSNAGRGYRALQTPSSFDWREQGILYVGKDLPEPRQNEKWIALASERLCALVDAAGGRSLVLCTSRANVERFGEVLRKQTDHRILAQGDRDTGRLTEEFVADETSVLVGTRSFWAGIDAAGAACVLVVIDKIPFPVPDEPLHAARRRRAEERDLNAFVTVDVPAAALILAQGAGRLIRRNTDRGVVAVLDSRLATKDYRVQLLDAVPPLRRSIDLAETCAFLEEAANSMPVPAKTVIGTAELDPRQLRTNLSTAETVAVRNAVACSVCKAELTERCRDEQGTSGFVHQARVAAAES
jgi:ATP-dependent DNA helicase DinG